MSLRFNDAFMAAGKRLSAVTRDGRDFWTTAVTPSGFIDDAFVSEAHAFSQYTVEDTRTYDEVVLAKGPWHYWKTPESNMLTMRDYGTNPDDMVVMATPPEFTLGTPVVRNGQPSTRWPASVVGLSNNRWRSNRSSDLWSSLNPDPVGLDGITVECWYRPNLADTATSIHLIRMQPGATVFHSNDRLFFRIHKPDGVAFIQATVIATSAWNSRTIAATTGVIHVVGTFVSPNVKIYVNGVQASSTVVDPGPDFSVYDPTAQDFVAPLSTGTAAGNFPQGGEIGNYAVYPRELSDAEIAENYLVGAPVR